MEKWKIDQIWYPGLKKVVEFKYLSSKLILLLIIFWRAESFLIPVSHQHACKIKLSENVKQRLIFYKYSSDTTEMLFQPNSVAEQLVLKFGYGQMITAIHIG